MASKNLQSLFEETLKDIYFAEKAIVKALPKMAKASHSEELEQAFQIISSKPRIMSRAWNVFLR